MTASTPPLRSTRLENLRLEGDRAWLDLEGEPIELTGEAAAPALQSFQTFYQTAYQAYQTQPDQPPTGSRAPWWQRLRGWIAQWIGGVRAAAGRVLGPETAGKETDSPAASSPAAPIPRAVAAASAVSPSAAPSASPALRSPGEGRETTRSTPEPAAPASSPRLSAQSSRTPAEPAPSPRTKAAAAPPSPVPLLRAAFADEKGVHLIWKNPSGRGAKAERELIYPFNSPVAAGLQACYGQLAEMGHAVVDLAAWQPAAEGVVERDLRARSNVEPRSSPNSVRVQARPEVALHPVAVAAKKEEAGLSPAGGPVAPSVESASAPGLPSDASAKEGGRASSSSAKTDPGRLMRLNPERSDIASRLVVIPAEGDRKPEVITGAETFFNALHAAADPAVPESERLTFLKCRQVKGELKVVELGFGRNAGATAEPARTETAAAWWKNAQKIRAAEAKAPEAAPPSVLGTTRPTPEPDAARQVELFGR